MIRSRVFAAIVIAIALGVAGCAGGGASAASSGGVGGGATSASASASTAGAGDAKTAPEGQTYFQALGRFAEPRLRRALAIVGDPALGQAFLATVTSAETRAGVGE